MNYNHSICQGNGLKALFQKNLIRISFFPPDQPDLTINDSEY